MIVEHIIMYEYDYSTFNELCAEATRYIREGYDITSFGVDTCGGVRYIHIEREVERD